MNTEKHVAVLMGGWSSERKVSLVTGAACARALENTGYRVSCIDVDRNIAQALRDLAPDVVFNALHGPYGEDGTIQGLLEILGIPYTHSGVLASSLAMNKSLTKRFLATLGVPVAEERIVSRLEAAKEHVMKPPYVIKPIGEGSSVGIFIVSEDMRHPPQELHSSDWSIGETLMIERFVPGRELTCASTRDSAWDVTEITTTAQFYDYAAKYEKGGSKHILPAKIKRNIYEHVQKLTLTAHRALGCRGVSRSDFRLAPNADGEDGTLVFLEINTQPGMTPTSLVPEQAAHAGFDFADLVSWMVEDASCHR